MITRYLLSCYTTSLITYLRRYEPTVADRLVAAVRLGVRTDLPEGQVAFSHHHRIDRYGGWQLDYTGAAQRHDAATGVREELATAGAVIVVANTYELPWSPSYRRSATPHWLLVTDARGDERHVIDPFEALLPHGEQAPFAGWVDEAKLVRFMDLPEDRPLHVARRDRLALGTAVDVPAVARWRWLHRATADPRSGGPSIDQTPDAGDWLLDTASALRWLADRLAGDDAPLDTCVDDLWAASRHHAFQVDWLQHHRLVPTDSADLTGALWAELPRTLRFAADSACRGRPRPALVRTTLKRLADATDQLNYSTSLGKRNG